MIPYLILAGVQAVAGYQNADIIRQNGDLQAKINDWNAKFAELDAYNAEKAGVSNAARYDNVIQAAVGGTRAAYSANNVSIGYGTAGDVERDNKLAGMVNALQLKRNGQDAAVGYKTQAINIRLGGQMAQLQSRLNAGSAQTSGLMSAASTLVAGYDRSLSQGIGNRSHSGTSDKAWELESTTMNVNEKGDGVTSSPLGWWDRGNREGFYGHDLGPGWKPMSASGNFYFDPTAYDKSLGNYSFTSETGGR